MRTTMLATLAAITLIAACSDKTEAGKMQNESRLDGQPMAAPASVDELKAKDISIAGQMAGTRRALGGADAENAPAEQASQTTHTNAAFGTETLTPTMIIRTGSASVQVDSLGDGVQRVRALAARVGGFVANTQMQAGPNQIKSATLEIRLPSSRFDEAINGLTPLGKIESVNVSAEDVGEEFVDVTARAANSRRLEERLIQVLETKTGKLKDVLDVERELARAREEIERMDGRLRYLRARTSVSSLSITVHEPYPVVGQRGSTSVIGEAFKQSWRNFVQFTARLIAALGTIIPTVVILVAMVAAVIIGLRRFAKKTQQTP
jgi:hypothetical protein